MLQRIERCAELKLCAAVRGDQAAVGAERDESGEQRVDAILVCMKAYAQRFRALVRKQMVLDQLRGHAHERERMRAEAARIAAHVERAERAAERIDDRRARARQDVIGAQEMLGAVHGDRLSRRECGADRIGAARAFGPRNAGAQRDAVGFFDEVVVADAVQDDAGGVGEEHEALRIGDLCVEVFHHGPCMGEQRVIRVEQFAQRDLRQRREIGALVRAQADRGRSGVRLREQVDAARGGGQHGRLRHRLSPVGPG